VSTLLSLGTRYSTFLWKRFFGDCYLTDSRFHFHTWDLLFVRGILSNTFEMAPIEIHGNSNGGSSSQKRAIRIAGASGGVFDRFRSIQDFAKDPTIDVIFGDWISEISMTFRGSQRAERATDEEALAFEMSFIAALDPAVKDIAKHKQKVAVNAGSCDAAAMAKKVQQLCKDKGTDLKVSYIVGDDVTEQFKGLLAKGEKFLSLPSETPITDWGVEPICAQAYLGGVGIAEALKEGADIGESPTFAESYRTVEADSPESDMWKSSRCFACHRSSNVVA
jgi:hypothetical protein